MVLKNEFDIYKEEIELIHAQNRVECDMYSIIAYIIRASKYGGTISLRDVSTRRTTNMSKIFKGTAGFPDFIVRTREKSNDKDNILGVVEIKYIWVDLDKQMEQLKKHVLYYKRVLYTNGLIWRYYESDNFSEPKLLWEIKLGRYINSKITWYSNGEWVTLLENLDTINWAQQNIKVIDNPIDAISHRTSYRGIFKDIPIPKEHLRIILEAGLSAPSGCNKQTTSLIAVDNKKTVDKIKNVIQPPIAKTAPAFICVLTQKVIAYRDKCYNIQDYSAAIENMLLTIVELGYQSCWYEGHITDDDNIGRKIADLLNVPKEYDLVCLLPIGIATENINKVEKKSFKERAWFNSFGG